jgi:hypothetical protein
MAALGETPLHSYSAAQLVSGIGRGDSFKPSHGIPFKNDGFVSWTVEKIYYVLWGEQNCLSKWAGPCSQGGLRTRSEGSHVLYYILFDLYGLVSPINLSQVMRSPRIPPVF